MLGIRSRIWTLLSRYLCRARVPKAILKQGHDMNQTLKSALCRDPANNQAVA